jgi:DeoR/GlpR family transcriptional regulator of sugar metabolism
LIDMQLAMIRAARKVIFCMDSTKLGAKSLFFLCSADQVQTLVTNDDANPAIVSALRKKGVDVHLVSC